MQPTSSHPAGTGPPCTQHHSSCGFARSSEPAREQHWLTAAACQVRRAAGAVRLAARTSRLCDAQPATAALTPQTGCAETSCPPGGEPAERGGRRCVVSRWALPAAASGSGTLPGHSRQPTCCCAITMVLVARRGAVRPASGKGQGAISLSVGWRTRQRGCAGGWVLTIAAERQGRPRAGQASALHGFVWALKRAGGWELPGAI